MLIFGFIWSICVAIVWEFLKDFFGEFLFCDSLAHFVGVILEAFLFIFILLLWNFFEDVLSQETLDRIPFAIVFFLT